MQSQLDHNWTSVSHLRKEQRLALEAKEMRLACIKRNRQMVRPIRFRSAGFFCGTNLTDSPNFPSGVRGYQDRPVLRSVLCNNRTPSLANSTDCQRERAGGKLLCFPRVSYAAHNFARGPDHSVEMVGGLTEPRTSVSLCVTLGVITLRWCNASVQPDWQ